jgi:cytochrome c biogenesis protein CcmG, thiol:disulfide interchange protein DsbE
VSAPAAPHSTPQVSRWALWLPLGLFAGFVVLVMVGLLRPAERTVASQMVGKPLPEFALSARVPDRPGLSRGDLIGGKPRLLNVFASWCVPCITEAPVLGQLRLVGVAIRDRQDDVTGFLARHGNPYSRIGADDVSAVQFALGSSGVPESFIVAADGTIAYQHIGEIRADQVPMILAKLKEAEQ